MNRKYWLFRGLATTCALLFLSGGDLHAQSLSYSPILSPLPAQVGKPFTITLLVPSTIPDGTNFRADLSETGPNGPVYPYPAGGQAVSSGHRVSISIPAPTTPGVYTATVSQDLSGTEGTVPPLALNSSTFQFIVSPAGQSPNPLATFTGDYSFYFQGQTNSAPGQTGGLAMAGSFTADGNGKITGGTADLNTSIGLSFQNAGVTGTYQLDAMGRGAIVLTTPAGPLTLNLFVAPSEPGVVVAQGRLAPPAGFTGTGELSTAVYFFGEQDYGNSGDGAPSPPFTAGATYTLEANTGGFRDGIGLLSFNFEDGTLSGVGEAVAGTPDVFTTTKGTFSQSAIANPQAPGRYLFTLSARGQAAGTPTHYAGYQGTNAVPQPMVQGGPQSSVIYFLSLDPHPANALVVGKITR